MTVIITREELIEQVSGGYLTEQLSIVEQDIEDSDTFVTLIDSRLTERYEDARAVDVWDYITMDVDDLQAFLRSKGVTVK